ncbi:MAG TPA: tetratricopeptide repeat protein [Desulfuromonadales bacterium]|nr:tetratricopeptide repeat protein [Desulfuromonadales bacterium]
MFKEESRELYFGLFVAAVAFLVYANSLGNGFALDDDSVILNNPALKNGIISLFNSIDTTNETQLLPFYRPVTYLTFFIEGQLHGFNPFFIRLCNVLLHSANTFLVYRLARSLFKGTTYTPIFVALLFALHPLQSEGVDFNAGGRNTMLTCFFSITSYLLHSRSILQQKAYSAVAGAAMFLAALFSKESALMILPFILALEIAPFRSSATGARLQSIIRLIPYFAAATIYIIMRWMTLSKLGIQTSIIPGIGTNALEAMYVTTDLSTRMLNNLYIIPAYLWSAINPTALANRYMVPDDLNLLALPLSGAWFCILGGMVWLCTKGRSSASLFGAAWLVLFWLPVSGIVFVPGAQQADRFIYIPAIGFWIIIVDQITRAFPFEKPAASRYASIIITLILLVMAGLTVRRNLDWRSNLTLYTRFVAQYPENVHARVGLGKAYYDKGKLQNIEMAEHEFEKAVSMDPNFPMIFTFLGNIKLNREDLKGALYNYSKAIEVYPYDKEARLNRGITLEKLGRPKEALTDYLFYLTSPDKTDNIPGGRLHAEQRIREISR